VKSAATAPVTLATLGLAALGLAACGSSTASNGGDAGPGPTPTADTGADVAADTSTGTRDATSIFGFGDSSTPGTDTGTGDDAGTDAPLDAPLDVTGDASGTDATADTSSPVDSTTPTPDATTTPDSAADAPVDTGAKDTGAGGCQAVTVPTGNGGAMACAAPVTGTCGPGSLAGFTATSPPPTGLHQGKCTPAQSQAVYDGCLGANATNVTCTAAVNANGACYACIFTDQSASSWGPVVNTAGNVANLNVGGCLTLLEPCNAACGATLEEDLECEEFACGTNCPITSSAASSTAYAGCASSIDSCDPNGCATYFYGTSCASSITGPNHPGSVCFASQNSEAAFRAAFLGIVPVFCGN
jgi:hypothetical protein